MQRYDCLEKLKKVLKHLGVERGDMLYIASDATLLLAEARKYYGVKTAQEREAFLHALVNVLQEAVGAAGTLLFPVFTWAFCRGEPFDVRVTKGEVGALNNWVMAHRKEFRRTQNPMYSFMVWGGEAENLLALSDVDAWDETSPFAYLHHHGGRMLLLHVSLQRAFTFMHYVERALKVPYRYLKNFRADYTDENGKTEKRSYILYVRDRSIVSHEKLPDAMLETPGAMLKEKWGNLLVKSIDLPRAYDIIKEDLLQCGGRYCYQFENYQIDWKRGATHGDDFSH